jgi:hypothetical protein
VAQQPLPLPELRPGLVRLERTGDRDLHPSELGPARHSGDLD